LPLFRVEAFCAGKGEASDGVCWAEAGEPALEKKKKDQFAVAGTARSIQFRAAAILSRIPAAIAKVSRAPGCYEHRFALPIHPGHNP